MRPATPSTLLLAVLCLAPLAFAECARALPLPGDPDPSFGPPETPGFVGGLGAPGFEHLAGDVAIDHQGRILVASIERQGADTRTARIRRYLPSGVLDLNFAAGGVYGLCCPTLPEDATIRLAIDESREIYAGTTVQIDGNEDPLIVRLDAAGGLLDAKVFGFDLADDNADVLTDLVVGGGKVVAVAGVERTGSTDYDFGILVVDRLTLELDPSFDGDGRKVVFFDLGGGDHDWPSSVAFDGAGGILVAGRGWTDIGSQATLARLDANGQILFKQAYAFTPVLGLSSAENEFTGLLVTHAIGESAIWAAATTADPRFLLSTDDLALVKIGFDGATASGWGTAGAGWQLVGFENNGTVLDDYASALGRDSRGRFVLAGTAIDDDGDLFRSVALARLEASGALDSSFGTGGRRLLRLGGRQEQAASELVIQPDDRLVLVGTSGLPFATDEVWVGRLVGDLDIFADDFETGNTDRWGP